MSNEKKTTEAKDAAIDTARLLVEGRPINEWLADRKVEDGNIIGHVLTDKIGSKCTFVIMSVEELIDQADFYEDAGSFEESAKHALHESGMFEWGY